MGLDIIETFMAVEAEFDVEVPDAEMERMATVGDLFDYVRAHVDGPSGTEPDERYAGPLWERYLTIVARQIGVPRDQLRPDARWVQDLELQ